MAVHRGDTITYRTSFRDDAEEITEEVLDVTGGGSTYYTRPAGADRWDLVRYRVDPWTGEKKLVRVETITDEWERRQLRILNNLAGPLDRVQVFFRAPTIRHFSDTDERQEYTMIEETSRECWHRADCSCDRNADAREPERTTVVTRTVAPLYVLRSMAKGMGDSHFYFLQHCGECITGQPRSPLIYAYS